MSCPLCKKGRCTNRCQEAGKKTKKDKETSAKKNGKGKGKKDKK